MARVLPGDVAGRIDGTYPWPRGGRLHWARNNLEHFGGTFTPQYFFYNGQYWGYPPVSRVIAETRDVDPIYPPGVRH